MARDDSLFRRVVARRRDIRVAASLFLRDRKAGVAYARSASEIENFQEDADVYRAFVRRAAGRGVAREVASELPSMLVRVPAEHRRALLAVLDRSLSEPKAMPLLIEVVPGLYDDMPHTVVAEFVLEGLRVFRAHPLRAEAFLRRESGAGSRRDLALRPGLSLEEVRGVLLHYARAHCGDDVTLTAGTEGASASGIVLPERISRGDSSFLWYRVTTALLAGEIEFGTHVDPERTERALGRLADPALGKRLFGAFEGHRVATRVRGAYPGIDRDLRDLPADDEMPRSPVDQAIEAVKRRSRGQTVPPLLPAVAAVVDDLGRQLVRLSASNATVDDSLAATAGALATLLRLTPEKARPKPDPRDMDLPSGDGATWEQDSGEPDGRFEANDDGDQRTAPRHAVDRASRDAFQEMEAWLDREEPASGGRVDRTYTAEEVGEPSRSGGAASAQKERGVTYPEWDSNIGDYRPAWVTVVPEPCPADEGGAAFAAGVLTRHRSLIRRLRKGFEALKPELSPRPRPDHDGDDVDMDAAVDLHVARKMGVSRPERLYLRRNPVVRDVCSVFLVDLSSSTNEIANVLGQRILDVEKEALLCLAEALDALGDRYAIDGFSGYGRDHVAYYTAKGFDEPLDATVRARVGALRWRMENRDGAAIRHATRRLAAEPARTKLLWLLSDGRPLDCGCDRYHDRYAQRDTHRALLEARRAGVHPFCLTVDPRGSDYLAEMYGDAYVVVEQASQLVEVLPRVYRRLTR